MPVQMRQLRHHPALFQLMGVLFRSLIKLIFLKFVEYFIIQWGRIILVGRAFREAGGRRPHERPSKDLGARPGGSWRLPVVQHRKLFFLNLNNCHLISRPKLSYIRFSRKKWVVPPKFRGKIT